MSNTKKRNLRHSSSTKGARITEVKKVKKNCLWMMQYRKKLHILKTCWHNPGFNTIMN